MYGLKDGDELTIYTNDRGTILWKDDIRLEYERLHTPYPGNPQYGQQLVFERWVHGFQIDLETHVWAKWFFNKLPAVLLRNES